VEPILQEVALIRPILGYRQPEPGNGFELSPQDKTEALENGKSRRRNDILLTDNSAAFVRQECAGKTTWPHGLMNKFMLRRGQQQLRSAASCQGRAACRSAVPP
jgi:hypothetical protein